ncbi:MAG: TonB family protein [Pseudomonadota bacterium]
MNYVAQSRRPNAGAILGSLAIPAGFGALLIAGLAVTVVMTPAQPRLKGFEVKVEPIEPPPPPKPVERQTTPETKTTQVIPPAPRPTVIDNPTITIPGPTIDATPLSGLGDTIVELPPLGGDVIGPPAPPLPDPIAATPRGDAGRWITDRDYRARWIREGLTGVAGFTVTIDPSGRVSDCTITRSTGHDVLDGATCRLLTRRARFNPARDANGSKVEGTFSNSVTWQIPE